MAFSAKEKDGGSEFNKLFKAEFVTLFRHRKKNREKIKSRLCEMVAFVGKGFRFRDDEHRHDVINEVNRIVLAILDRKSGEIDPNNNPSNFFRTTINREMGSQLKNQGRVMEEATDATYNIAEKPDVDPMERARACREQEDLSLKDLQSKVLFSRGIDREISRFATEFDETGEIEHLQSVMNCQKIRKLFLNEFLPMKVGTLRFSIENVVRFAPKEG